MDLILFINLTNKIRIIRILDFIKDLIILIYFRLIILFLMFLICKITVIINLNINLIIIFFKWIIMHKNINSVNLYKIKYRLRKYIIIYYLLLFIHFITIILIKE